jgi:ribosomal protein S18 acetylase RimI-like enzyme
VPLVRRGRQDDPVTEIRLVGPDDWKLWRELRLDALADAPDAFGSTLADWRDAPESRWRERLAGADDRNFVAFLDGIPVGMATATPADPEAVELISMFVAPSARGHGVADDLITAVVDRARELRARTVRLDVRHTNGRATAVYRRHGFTPSPVPAEDPAERTMTRPVEDGSGDGAEEAPVVRLDPMDGKEFEEFLAASVEHYAESVAGTGVPPETARAQSETVFQELLPDGLKTENVLLRMARDGDDVVGWVWITLPDAERPNLAWIHSVTVLPEHRGKGYGRAVMLAAEAEVTARGVRRLGLNVFAANTTAVGLYESLGYAVTAQQMAKTLEG